MFGVPILAVSIWLAPFASQVPEASFQFPKTRAGEIAEAWFKGFNSGETDAMVAFERTYRIPAKLEQEPAEKRGARYGQLRKQLGTLTPRAMLGEDGGVLRLLVDSSRITNMSFEASFKLEPEPPRKLVSFGLRPSTGVKKLGPYDAWKDIRDLIDQVRKDAEIPAVAVGVIRGGEIVDHAVVGFRRSDSDVPVRGGDAFHLGSAAKSITATMIARLVETKVLDWDSTISGALPGVDVLPAYRERTLDELLGHRSGLPGYLTFDDEEMARRLGVASATAEEQRAAFVAEALRSEPATDGTMSYSNAGYAVAARMAEVATGKPWEVLIREHVFEPLKMTTAGHGWPATVENPEAPHGHYRDGKSLRPQKIGEYVFRPFIAPAGHVHASALDFSRFALAHLRGLRGHDGPLEAATVQRLHTPPKSESYAGGWVIEQLPDGGTRHWHDGSAGTFYASIQLFPERDLGLVVLLNAADQRVVNAISEAVTVKWD